MMLLKLTLTGLMLLSLQACGTLSPPAPEVVQLPAPSPALLAGCPVPERDGSDNGALARLAQALRNSLDACNADKASLRELFQ